MTGEERAFLQQHGISDDKFDLFKIGYYEGLGKTGSWLEDGKKNGFVITTDPRTGERGLSILDPSIQPGGQTSPPSLPALEGIPELKTPSMQTLNKALGGISKKAWLPTSPREW